MATTKNVSKIQVTAVHMECMHNRASEVNGFVLDGCVLFEPGNEMACAACGCHRNFHRRVAVDLPAPVIVIQAQSESPQKSSTGRTPSPEPPAIPTTNRFQLSHVSSTRDAADVPPVAQDARPAERRARVTKEQIEMIKEVMDNNEWKMFRFYSREEVEQICSEIGIERMTLKNWIYKLRRELRDNNEAASD